ncbi:MAG: NADH-quinone oxidoreductase subunit L [Bacteroidetes bacterium]|nr:NADH-quinone oxidoreductase subunit L [Bacteroidota bacterium]
MNILIWLIPLFPLLGFLILGLGFKRIPKAIASFIGTGTIGISFIFSIILFINSTHQITSSPVHQLTSSPVHHLFTWFSIGNLTIPFSFLIDPLSILMLLIVTGVGFIIHVYSVGYMGHDEGFNRFFANMNLFVFFMLLLVMGANYPVMFIGWEGVGLCSYLLIGFWFRNHEFNAAAIKAFIMNRIGDLGFLLGMFLLFTTFKSLNFNEIFSLAKGMTPGNGTMVAITLLLFVGAIGKSAQIPLYTWLPDAMAGPTPVSALIHAATMVTAGVYMIARSHILYLLAPATMNVITAVSLFTALFAATIAIYQNDIKKILAYSTISQLGYMFLGLSMGAFTGAMFHLTTHAFFKALLFLAAGSLIHALNGEQDIRKMGGLKSKLTKTWWTFLIGTVAISGIPPFSGFFSKDEILLSVFRNSITLWTIATIGALLTAFYMFRLLFLTFYGKYRGQADRESSIHESPKVMIIPLITLAVLSALGGIINLPGLFGGSTMLEQYLAPVFAGAEQFIRPPNYSVQPLTEWLLIAVIVVYIGAMVLIAYSRWMKNKLVPDAKVIEKSFFTRLCVNKFYVDEAYDAVIVKPVLWFSRILDEIVDTGIIDRVVTGTGRVTVWTGNTVRYLQTGHVGFYLFVMIGAIIAILVYNLLIL